MRKIVKVMSIIFLYVFLSFWFTIALFIWLYERWPTFILAGQRINVALAGPVIELFPGSIRNLLLEHIEKIGLFLFFEEIKLIPGLLFFMSWSFVRATRIWEYAAIPLGFLYGFITILLIVEFSKHL